MVSVITETLHIIRLFVYLGSYMQLHFDDSNCKPFFGSHFTAGVTQTTYSKLGSYLSYASSFVFLNYLQIL